MLHQVESRTMLPYQNGVPEPAFHGHGRPSVFIDLVGVRRPLLLKLKPDHIVGASMMIEALLLSRDHIIRGTDHGGKIVDLVQIVAETAEWLDIGHAPALQALGKQEEYSKTRSKGQRGQRFS